MSAALKMTQQEALKKTAIFFFYSLLDEPLSLRAAQKAAADINREAECPASKLVYVTRKIWEKFRGKVTRGRYRISGSRGWIPPEGVDLTVWKEFQKNAEEDELLAVIWTQVLGISEDDISKGLGVTRGTVRYRASRGLRKIGMLAAGGSSVH